VTRSLGDKALEQIMAVVDGVNGILDLARMRNGITSDHLVATF